jgi:hypothetical protein
LLIPAVRAAHAINEVEPVADECRRVNYAMSDNVSLARYLSTHKRRLIKAYVVCRAVNGCIGAGQIGGYTHYIDGGYLATTGSMDLCDQAAN